MTIKGKSKDLRYSPKICLTEVATVFDLSSTPISSLTQDFLYDHCGDKVKSFISIQTSLSTAQKSEKKK